MSDGSLIFDTKLDGKGFKDGMSKLQSTGTKAMKAVATATVATVAAIGGIAIAATKVGSGFEKSMSQLGSVG